MQPLFFVWKQSEAGGDDTMYPAILFMNTDI